jgi:hypothetical protein
MNPYDILKNLAPFLPAPIQTVANVASNVLNNVEPVARQAFQPEVTEEQNQAQQAFQSFVNQNQFTAQKPEEESHKIPQLDIDGSDLVSEGSDEQVADEEEKSLTSDFSKLPLTIVTGIKDSGYDESQNNVEEKSKLKPKIETRGSQQQLEDLQKSFQESQDRLYNLENGVEQNLLLAQYGQLGMSPNDPIVQDALNNRQPSMTAKEIVRRMTDGEGNLKQNPLDWNLLGFTSQNIASDAARNLYDFNFSQEDSNLDPLARVAAAQRRRRAVDNAGDVLDPYAIDNGVDPRSREALFMTGEQYIKYRNQFGIPGRDVKDIDPNEIYSKQDEQEQYGFVPYITSQESLQKFHDDAAPHAVSNVFNRLANARRENTDFNVNFNGKDISGHDLIHQGNLWWKRNAGKINDAEVITDPSKVTEDSVPYTYVLTDSSGAKIPAKSALVNSYIDEQNRPVMQFEDGDIWTFDDMDDYQRSLGEQVAQDGQYTAYWRNIEPLVLDDGTRIRADQAETLLNNSNYQNFADYGNFNFSNPYIEDPFKDRNGNFNLNPAENSFLPWITDVALGSVPYFFKPTAATQGIGNAAASYTGFQPGYQDFLNGTYSLLSDNPTREEQLSATLGSLAMPVTEHLWGNIGSNILGKKLMSILGKNEKDIAPLIRYGMGTVGEGLEEIPGNVVEQFQSGSGLSNWYADDMYRDANGNLTTENTGTKAYDGQGNVIKNSNTDWGSRLRNFGADIPLAFIGGATLGGTIGAPAIHGYYNEYTPRKRERDEFGDVQERPDFNSNLVVDLTDEERDYYNR